MKNISKIFYLIIFYQLFSCNQVNNEKSANKRTFEKEFEVKLKNKPKLFSKFWVDMTKSEFNKTVSILKKERKIEQSNDSLFYKINSYTMYLKEHFKDNQLKKINLYGSLVSIGFSIDDKMTPYRIFKEKYNLPELIKKGKYYEKSTIPNSDYNPTYQVYLKNGIKENIPNNLIDSKPFKYKYFKRSEEKEKRVGLAHKILTANKSDNIKIIFKEVSSEGIQGESKGGRDLVYSLEDTKNKISLEVEIAYRIGPNEFSFISDKYKKFNDQKSMETIGNYLIRKNSKYLTKYNYQNFDLKVTYTTNEYYKLEQEQIINSEKERKELRRRIEDAEKEGGNRRKKEALDEI